METGITKNQIIGELTRSPHGKLTDYLVVGKQAARLEPEFLAHLIAWDRQKGQIRDAKVALPIVSLTETLAEDLAENSLAHFAALAPRQMLQAYRFSLEVRPTGRMRELRRIVEQSLREDEDDAKGWDRTAIQHRHTLKELYALAHIKPNDRSDYVLFKGKYPSGSIFETVAQLKDMSTTEAAGAILQRKIPFLIAMGALGKKAKEMDLVLALIERMSGTELVTNTKMLEKLGIKTNPALRGAYEKALERASTNKTNILKTSRAAEAVEDEGLRTKLRGAQERQINALGGVEGNWLVLGDKSGSMASCIEGARQIAATLAKMVKGKVWLTFFDTSPMTLEVTGLPLDMISKATQHVTANGGTSVGCGLQRMLDSKEEIDGIAVVSDGEENESPFFAQVYPRYSAMVGKDVPVYFYKINQRGTTSFEQTMKAGKHDLQVFDLTTNPDFYSIPNLVQTMRSNRYSLVDEIMGTKLLTMKDVFKSERKEKVHA